MSERADRTQEPANAAAYFGKEVKALRDALGLSQEEFASELHYQQSQVSKVESGSVLASEAFAAAMDRVAGTPGVYVRLRARLSKQGHPEWFVPYVELERNAASILDYSSALIMGILQTPEYATAVFRGAHPREDADSIKARVELRLTRREVMTQEQPPLLWVVLNEACLRGKVGGAQVMRNQLEHLLVEAESPHVTLQVLPFAVGAPPAAESFTLLTFDKAPPSVYADTGIGGQTDDSPATVARLSAKYDLLRATAASPDESLAMIRTAMREFNP
jgi:transcriptional regulator with XRE-family HTH domain